MVGRYNELYILRVPINTSWIQSDWTEDVAPNIIDKLNKPRRIEKNGEVIVRDVPAS